MTIPVVVVQLIAVLGILLSIAGLYAAPEYSGPLSGPAPNQWVHLLAHLPIGIVVPILLSWAVASLMMLAAKNVSRRRVAART